MGAPGVSRVGGTERETTLGQCVVGGDSNGGRPRGGLVAVAQVLARKERGVGEGAVRVDVPLRCGHKVGAGELDVGHRGGGLAVKHAVVLLVRLPGCNPRRAFAAVECHCPICERQGHKRHKQGEPRIGDTGAQVAPITQHRTCGVTPRSPSPGAHRQWHKPSQHKAKLCQHPSARTVSSTSSLRCASNSVHSPSVVTYQQRERSQLWEALPWRAPQGKAGCRC